MTILDIAELLGYLVSVWAAGFSGGYVLTQFKRAIEQAG
jgi:hypothetical protein